MDALILPPPIDLYFAADREEDLSLLDRCFAADGVVRDEGETIKGIPAIKAWKAAALAKYRFTSEPISVDARDSKVIVRCRVSGNFPGSPITLDHVFEIEDRLVVGLKIG